MSENTIHPKGFLPLPLLRAVSLLLTFTILVGDPSWASGVSYLFRTSFSSDLRDLSVPSKLGTITDKWIAPAVNSKRLAVSGTGIPDTAHRAPFVVLIQDLHANIGVQ